jgi:L-seryl-tRNA(Ser) seleniumtransferase
LSPNSTELNTLLRRLPQVEQVLAAPELADTLASWRRDIVKSAVQSELARERAELTGGLIEDVGDVPNAAAIAHLVAAYMHSYEAIVFRRVVNATGVVLHTNLGRAVLSPAAQEVLREIASGYCNLEVDLDTGQRSRRDGPHEPRLRTLTGASAATVVNNCAAAVFLTLNALANGREVVTSRGELVEIGGSFRVPDIVRASGCTLVEVGSTNRTRVADYAAAINGNTALILKTHRSNFTVSGFTEEATLEDLAQLGQERGIPVVYDLGSGYLAAEGTPFNEPEIRDAVASGATLTLFSGDKLLGGPQAGIILGAGDHGAALVKRLREHPLWRALRIDKFTAATLAATLRDHMRGAPGSPCHPANVLARSQQTSAYADVLVTAINAVKPGWKLEVIVAPGSWGGGSQPDEVLPSHAVVIEAPGISADLLDQKLRTGAPAVMGYKLSGRYALNVLTLLDGDAERIVAALQNLNG